MQKIRLSELKEMFAEKLAELLEKVPPDPQTEQRMSRVNEVFMAAYNALKNAHGADFGVWVLTVEEADNIFFERKRQEG